MIVKCNEHSRVAEKNLAVIKNVTQLDNPCLECAPNPPNTTCNEAGIPAKIVYPDLPARSVCGDTTCGGGPPVVNCATYPCGAYPVPLPVSASAGGATKIYDNYFKLSEETEDISECRKIGFFSVYAMKSWHGRFGFLHNDGTCGPDLGTDCYGVEATSPAGDCTDCNFHFTPDCPGCPDRDEQRLTVPSTSLTKYRTRRYQVTRTLIQKYGASCEHTSTYVGTFDGTTTIAKNSGMASSTAQYDFSGFVATDLTGHQPAPETFLAGVLGVDAVCGKASGLQTGAFGMDERMNGLEIPAQVHCYDSYDPTGACSPPFDPLGWDSAHPCPDDPDYHGPNLACEEKEYEEGSVNCDTGCFGVNCPETLAAGDLTITNTSLTLEGFMLSGRTCCNDGSRIVSDKITVQIDLSDAYTSDDVNADANTLLATWNMEDRIQCPLRTDCNTSEAPLVTYNELTPASPNFWGGTPPVFDGEDFLHNGEEQTTGDVVASLPWASQAGGTILGAPLPNGCEPYWNFHHENYGLSCTPERLILQSHGALSPFRHATQWTNLKQSSFFLSGGSQSFSSTEGGFSYSMQFENPITSARTAQWPGVLIKGKYAEAIMFARPQHDWQRPCGDADRALTDPATVTCDEGEVTYAGDLRYLSAPDCEANTNGKTGDYLFKEWQFDFRDFAESWRWCKEVRDRYYENLNRAELDPPLAACTALTGCSPVRYTNYDPNDIYDTRPDDPRVVNDDYGNTIGYGSWWEKVQNTTQKRPVFTSCKPVMVYIQPNQPSAAEGGVANWLQMPDLTCDTRYGALWLARVEQWMLDPLYKTSPSEICDPPDPPKTYCEYPFEEARSSVPAGKPALPADAATLGCPDYITNRGAGIGNPASCAPQIDIELFANYDGDPYRFVSYGIYWFAPPKISCPWVCEA